MKDHPAAELHPPHWEVTTMAAVGRVPDSLENGVLGPLSERPRRPLDDLLWRTD